MKFFWKYCEVITLILLGGFILVFWWTGKLNFFVNPRYEYFIVFSALVIVLTGLYRILDRSRCHVCCSHHEHQDHFIIPKKAIFFVFLIAIIGCLLEPRPLSAQTANNRGISFDLSDGGTEKVIYDFTLEPEKRTLIQWVKLLNFDPEPDNFKGQSAKVSGFVLRSELLPPDHFLIARFIIACCAADARPIGLMVHYDPETFDIHENDWVEISGVMDETQVTGERRSVLELSAVTPIAVPDDPYEYKY